MNHFARGALGRPTGHRLGTASAALVQHNGIARINHFNGIRGLNTNGFNRNAFGGTRGWNNWGQSHWGAGWNNWGSGWGYWAGPVFWPFLYGDALSFALWPYDLYDPFFAYGPDYLFASIFWPGPFYDYGPYAFDDYYGGYYYGGAYPYFDIYGYPPGATNYYGYYRHRRHHSRHRATRHEQQASGINGCSGLAPGVTDLPIDRMKKAIKPTDQQVILLDKLQEASDKANSTLRASCPSEVPLTPIGRLDAIGKRLNAMIDAVNTIRDPLTAFDNSLDQHQKDELAKIGRQGHKRSQNSQDLAVLCKKQTAGFTLLPVQRINDIVKPTADQESSFDALKSASTDAAKGLESSCPSEMPTTVTGRLDALTKRLTALNDAVGKVKPALADFYDKLSDEQKARFNVIGNASASNTSQNKSGGSAAK